ncbi:Lrp/AsnC ligand binding domain-containing protein [Inquilinus sp.]|uniref:Lrp/AsnC ligand binding domain-containing protein n=1 Tax=Inquilinus sp. TaxID=1932117 RepID=UPI0031DC7564
MRPIFIMVKCELGRAYDTAEHAVDEIEEVSEIYSISGQFDLMVKCYLPEDMDVGRFVNSRIHALPHIKDTMTLITFNAFAGKS